MIRETVSSNEATSAAGGDGPAHHPIARGVALALAAALAFGLTTPIVARASVHVGALAGAALLYLGAALGALALGAAGKRSDGALRRGDLARVGLVALFGAALAPVLLVWGLARVGGTVGSLVLDLEAVFTIALAWLVYREPVGRRVALAGAIMVAGGAALALDAWRGGATSALGLAAVAGATLAWAIDNTLSRPLAERDPVRVVGAKAMLGASFTGLAAVLHGDALPGLGATVVLLACGATGYGLSLRLYLLAQRRIGAARTGSVFALAPLIGAAAAIALGDRALGHWTIVASALFVAGVLLHVTERHAHAHVHEAIEHEHPHRHDDGHHDHVHDPPVAGEHTHPHRHDRIEHEHAHAPDVHHAHVH